MSFFQKLFATFAILTFGFAGLQLAVPASASAQLFKDAKSEACKGATPNRSGCDRRSSNQLSNIVKTVINIFSLIVGIVAVVMIIFNGFRFITSGGDSQSVSGARNGVLFAIVGLLIVGFAQFIVRFVLGNV